MSKQGEMAAIAWKEGKYPGKKENPFFSELGGDIWDKESENLDLSNIAKRKKGQNHKR